MASRWLQLPPKVYVADGSWYELGSGSLDLRRPATSVITVYLSSEQLLHPHLD